jgi:anti-anti-sigma factor
MDATSAPTSDGARSPDEDQLVHVDPHTVRVVVRGEIDLATRESMAMLIDQALLEEPDELVLDLTAVTFLSASGGAVLSRARKAATARGATLSVMSRPGVVRWVVRFIEQTDAPTTPEPAAWPNALPGEDSR